MEKRISDRGYYPVRLTRGRDEAWSADPALVDARFKAGDARAGRTLDGTSPTSGSRGKRHPLHRLAGQRRHLRDRPDHRRRPSWSTSGRATRSTSTGSRSCRPAGRTPRRGTRSASCPRTSCARASTGSSPMSPTRHRAIFNFHAPPYGSNLDSAPKLDADMNYVSGGQALIPVGSTAVRDSILEYGRSCRSTATSTRGGARSRSDERWRSTPEARTRTGSSRPPSSISTPRKPR